MHNQPGPQWDAWNRKMRRILIDTQSKEGCAAGSWDPDKPTKDIWGDARRTADDDQSLRIDARGILSIPAAV